MSYETWALVRDIVWLPPVAMKGIGWKVVPYLVDGPVDAAGNGAEVFR